jgi:hypothetical protein
MFPIVLALCFDKLSSGPPQNIIGYSAMNVSHQKPRSSLAALILLGGWLDILIGAFFLVVGSKEGFVTGLNSLATGAVLVGLIYYRERVRKTE